MTEPVTGIRPPPVSDHRWLILVIVLPSKRRLEHLRAAASAPSPTLAGTAAAAANRV